MTTLASWTEQLARALLQERVSRRWAHSQGVAARARGLAAVPGADADLLEAAAWLHDIGYAPDLTFTGLHQLDGARYLRDAQHADALLCLFPAAESGRHVDAAASVAGGAGRYREDREAGVPEGIAGDAGP